ncbi:MAG: hypothetical protein JXL81_08285 [Deltaproteobacteria bacterium]|nr:hypothetical protein [Deltaproteobacteria bacterium]
MNRSILIILVTVLFLSVVFSGCGRKTDPVFPAKDSVSTAEQDKSNE